MGKIIKITATTSTNRVAKDYIKTGIEHGTVIIADNQTAGKGRLGKEWISVNGKGLYCSIIIKPNCPREKYSLITLLTGLVVAETVEQLVSLKVQLKWPNDIIINDKKCAGILCEAILDDNNSDYIIVGIGLNLDLEQDDIPEKLFNKITSVFLETCKKIDRFVIFEAIHSNLLERLKVFEMNGFEAFYNKWKQRDYLKGKKAEWCTVDKKIILGEAKGLSETGEYYIRDVAGNIHQVLSGDVSLAKV